jgi:hypothetical protein
VAGVRALVACAALAALLAALPSPAGAAARQVPHGWFGVMADGPLLAGGVKLDAEAGRMSADGVESVRAAFLWSDAQPYATAADVPPAERDRFRDVAGVPTDFSAPDRVVEAAVSHGLSVLPVAIRAPAWAAADPAQLASPPRDPADYARFLTALVGRYGPGGSFWPAHPDLPVRPLRDWQVWNEPNLTRYWSAQPFATGYVAVLRAARAAIRAADPGARVVLCGLANFSWRALEQIYRAGGHGLFDVGAVHPFTGRPSGSVKIVRLNRAVMARHGDARLPLYISELTWSSAQGKTRNTFGWETTERGQAQRLTTAYRLLAAVRRSLRIARVYWYTWLTPDGGSPNSFDWSGLRKLTPHGPVDKPALAAYRRIARRLEGRAG